MGRLIEFVTVTALTFFGFTWAAAFATGTAGSYAQEIVKLLH